MNVRSKLESRDCNGVLQWSVHWLRKRLKAIPKTQFLLIVWEMLLIIKVDKCNYMEIEFAYLWALGLIYSSWSWKSGCIDCIGIDILSVHAYVFCHAPIPSFLKKYFIFIVLIFLTLFLVVIQFESNNKKSFSWRGRRVSRTTQVKGHAWDNLYCSTEYSTKKVHT